MKIYLYITLLTFSGNIFGQVNISLGEHYGCKYLEYPNYIVNKENVFFEYCSIHRRVDVKPEELVVIGKGLAYDSQHMFYNGMKLNIVPKNPYVLNTHVSNDGGIVYWINDGRLYRNEVKMYEIDTITFTVLGEGYFKDKNYIYYKGNPIKAIDSKTFVYNYPNSYDKNHVYYESNKRRINGNLQSVNGHFFKDDAAVYEYHSGYMFDFKPRTDIKVEDVFPIQKTKYGIVNDTLYYLSEVTPYHHIDISEIKIFDDEMIGFKNTILFRGYATDLLNYNSVEILKRNFYAYTIKDKNGSYTMSIGRQKGKSYQLILEPITDRKEEKNEPYKYTNITQIQMVGDTLFRNDYPFVLKSLLSENGVKSFDDIELVSLLSGYRMGCSRDTQSASNYYILKNKQGYWELMISDEHILKYIGTDYKF